MSDRWKTIKECPKCGEPFEATYWDPGGPFRNSETLDCPHCGHECESKVTAGTMHSRKLTPEEAADYLASKKTRS
jgi:hypothetical protein